MSPTANLHDDAGVDAFVNEEALDVAPAEIVTRYVAVIVVPCFVSCTFCHPLHDVPNPAF